MLMGRLTSSASTSTLKQIPTQQLRVGMFLVRILDSWWKSPFFTHRRLLQSSEEVQQLLQSGIQEVEIDLSQGLDVTDSEDEVMTAIPSFDATAIEDSPAPQSSESKHAVVTTIQGPEEGQEDPKERLRTLRHDVVQAMEGVFEGAKTGKPLSSTALQGMAKSLVQETMDHPLVLAEIYLLEQLKSFEGTLYEHVVDTAVLCLLVGGQLDWDPKGLQELAIAALIHDVGYMRLPHNTVQERGNEEKNTPMILQQHVDCAMRMLEAQTEFAPGILHMVHVHHERLDGSGYPQGIYGSRITEGGQLLGAIDLFEDLTSPGHAHASYPVGLGLRKLYQTAKKNQISSQIVEALIRILGVFPVGTFVRLTSEEEGVVVKHNPNAGTKPVVKVLRSSDGQWLEQPILRDLHEEQGGEMNVGIRDIMDSKEYPIKLQELADFS